MKRKFIKQSIEMFVANLFFFASIVLTNFLADEFLFEATVAIDVLKLERLLLLGDAEAVLTTEIVVRLASGERHWVADLAVGWNPIPLALLADDF